MAERLSFRINANTTVTADVNGIKDAMKVLSQYGVLCQEKCGLCESPDVSPRHDVRKGYDFYEMKCNHCGAALSFGQHKDTDTLFPKMRDGWKKWHDQPGRGDNPVSGAHESQDTHADMAPVPEPHPDTPF